MKHAALLLLAVAVASCGYRPVLSGTPPRERLAIVVASHLTPEPQALAGAVAAIRRELRSVGAYRAGQGYPRLVVQVLRVDEGPIGLQSSQGERPLPTARGSVVGVTVRGWVEAAEGAAPAVDTGDIRRTAQFASSANPALDADGYVDAVAKAAGRSGAALARRVLGVAEPGYGPL